MRRGWHEARHTSLHPKRSISRYVTSSQTERAVLRHFILGRGVILRHSLPYDGACHPHCSLDVRRACGLSRLVISLYLLSIAHPLPLSFFFFLSIAETVVMFMKYQLITVWCIFVYSKSNWVGLQKRAIYCLQV